MFQSYNSAPSTTTVSVQTNTSPLFIKLRTNDKQNRLHVYFESYYNGPYNV